MQTYSVIYINEEPYLRQDNPLRNMRHLVSINAYIEHEAQYTKAALPLINFVPGKLNYTIDELRRVWQIKDSLTGKWIPADGEFLTGESRPAFEGITEETKILSFQDRVKPWITNCFGAEMLNDIPERNVRFIEEALELVQSLGMPKEQILAVMKYTYGRPLGEPAQEVGGVMVTLAALCLANDIDLQQSAETELTRVWENIEPIREKQQTRNNAII